MGIQLNGSSGADIISSSDGTLTIDGTSTVSTPIVTNTITISDKISHSGDSNTHIRFAGDDTVTVETAGSEALRIDSDGKLLIGITASTSGDGNVQSFKPTGNNSTIVVGNVATSSSGLCRYDFCPSNSVVGARIECHATEDFSTTANRTADLVFVTRKDGTHSEKLRITSDGKVKIAVPTSKIGITTGNLDVWGDATSYPTLRLGSLDLNDEGEHIRFGRKDISADIRYHSIWGRSSATSGSNYLAVKIHNGSGSPFTDQVEALRITGDGKIGIGTDNPVSALDVRNANNTNPLLSLHHSDADVEGEVVRVGRVAPYHTIRYHSIKAKHGGAASSNYFSFSLHDGTGSPPIGQKEVLKIQGDEEVKATGRLHMARKGVSPDTYTTCKETFYEEVANGASHDFQTASTYGGGLVYITSCRDGNATYSRTQVYMIAMRATATSGVVSAVFNNAGGASGDSSFTVAGCSKGVTVTNNSGHTSDIFVTFDIQGFVA